MHCCSEECNVAYLHHAEWLRWRQKPCFSEISDSELLSNVSKNLATAAQYCTSSASWKYLTCCATLFRGCTDVDQFTLAK